MNRLLALSRKELPRLEAFVESDYARWFDPAVLELARKIIATGSFFEKGILHWCFENAVPLRAARADWTIVTYEQLVVEPAPVLASLAARLHLPDVGRMLRHLDTGSGTLSKSTDETRSLVAAGERMQLISKWRWRAGKEDERVAFEILEAFGIDAYARGRDMPREQYLVAHQTGAPQRNRMVAGLDRRAAFGAAPEARP